MTLTQMDNGTEQLKTTELMTVSDSPRLPHHDWADSADSDVESTTSTQVMQKDAEGNLIPGAPLGAERTTLRLKGYEFLSVLGRGGMGTVYLARQKSLDRYVAIKVIRGEFRADAEESNRLHDEALTMGMLSHPNVLSCYDVIRTSHGLFVVMEYIPGRLTGRMLVNHYGVVSEQIMVKILLSVVDGLSYIYHKGFMHRDLKPDNLMIYRDEFASAKTMEDLFRQAGTRVVICDFGIAQSVGSAVDATNVLGSPLYMAPEQFYAVELLDFRADIYSMACVAYYFLTGCPPFIQKDREELLDYKRSHGVPDPRGKNPEISSELSRIIVKMGRTHPDDRYQSYQELNDDLERLLTVDSIWFDRSRKRSKKRYTWKGILLGMSLVALLHGSWLFWHYVWKPTFNSVQISLARSLGYWKRVDDGGWTMVMNDRNERDTYLRGVSATPLVLQQQCEPEMSLDFKIRSFGAGGVRFGFKDESGRYLMYVDWYRGVSGNVTVFSLTGQMQKQVFIGELIQKSKFDWVHVNMTMLEKSVVISAEGKMLGVAHFHNKVVPCNFFMELHGTKIVDLKDVYRRQTD